MSSSPIIPVILAGGAGKRLWPLSRAARPKQFAPLDGRDTLLASTVRRMEDVGCGAPVFVTHDRYRWAVNSEAEALNLEGHRILLEPSSRNTAASICAAAELIRRENPDALLLISPSDHVVSDALNFAEAVAKGMRAAREGGIVLFGIKPSRPETGFGYIEAEDGPSQETRAIKQFLEKPDLNAAEEMFASGRFLWNAGIFLATAETLVRAFEAHAPNVLNPVKQSVDDAKTDLGFLRLGASFTAAPNVAFDTSVLERSGGWVFEMDPGWSDLGTWSGVWDAGTKDKEGCSVSGSATAIECRDSFLLSADEETRLVGVGLQGIAAVATRDAVLVVDMDNAQAVGKAVDELKSAKVVQAETFTRDDRPWGYFETLASGPRFQVKSICVRPGASLSLQSHAHRSEHWVVVEGTATVEISGERRLVTENQSVYIAVGELHRLANEGRAPLRLIEVQTGTYLGEDDIQRFEDEYQRT